MAEIIKDVENLWEKDSSELLTGDHGVEVRWLVNNFERFLNKAVVLEELVFEAKSVLDRTWEKLNVGKWTEVGEKRKQVYAIASYIRPGTPFGSHQALTRRTKEMYKVVGLLHENKPDALRKSIEVTDLGILLGSPFGSLSLTKLADILSSKLEQPKPTMTKRKNVERDATPKKIKLDNEIDTVKCPSLESFYKNYFTQNRPVRLTDTINHWPALSLWKDFEYIVEKAGHRTVPIELGKHYADGSYSQKLMKVSDFVREYLGNDDGGGEKIGYLAQHQLFDQVPELKRDITEPDYCALFQNPRNDGQTEINAWFGPKGTVSPLHFDPKHNLLCQVVGSKKIILYHQRFSPYLYPHDSTLLFNTSRVDVENPDLNAFPEFANAVKEDCVLNPGDVLYIPPKYWHHVRALENSFSVSFWWE